MKHLFKILTLTIGAILLSGGMLMQPVVAQEAPTPQQDPSQGIMKLPIMVDCGPREVVEKLLRDHGEIPTAQALVTWSLQVDSILEDQWLYGPTLKPLQFQLL